MSDELPFRSEPTSESKTGPLGSRTRGPDERREVPREGYDLFARQIALAYEREAVRLRRFRLKHPAPAEAKPAVDERGRISTEVLGTLLGLIQQWMGPPKPEESSADRPAEASQ